ncbi:MAG: hypothetical protein GKC07_01200 [Methanomicrobiales archaeon]|nr:hypothetical protein [Methanomicrobiales archaeon]
MFRFLKDRFSKEKEEQPLTIRVEDVPGLLDAREAQIAADLAAGTGDHRNAVVTARIELRELVMDLRSKEREEAYHPKLEKIAKNTLPLFEKSMLSSLAKDLPSDPGEFYTAASECLKGCVKGLAGPGRYLKGVFPDEMKEIRQTVDRIGREVNAMTPAIAESRRKREQIDGLRKTTVSLAAAIASQKTAAHDLSVIRDDIAGEEQVIDDLATTLAAGEAAAASPEIADLEAAVSGLRGEVSAADRALRADLAVISHLLRKGEKVLQRGEGASAAREIEPVVDMLAGSALPAEDQLLTGLARALPLVRSMIGSGEIVLKNKEERELFSTGIDIMARIRALYAQHRDAEARLRAAEKAYAAHPVIEKTRRAEREKETREARLAALREKMAAVAEREQAQEAEIPVLMAGMEQEISAIEGRTVTLIRDDRA